VPGIAGTYVHTAFFVVVAIKQMYAGHAKQAGLAVLAAASTARNGRFVVIVDEDIDPSNMKEVIWAMTTRCDPATDIEIVKDCWATPLDPRMPPEQTANGPHTNSRAIYYAVRPWTWRNKFPPVNRIDKEQRAAILSKYGTEFPFKRR
jgi:3-polyprenyl-4-hydroxybenzoate decarboxylase